ncbi:hypothetical protein AAE02nite_06700 [Adhaeribacter aerolatus]|uniref:Uncharacterized protein n=1 Tax=Adhaeribacter aerolatus TaxID=670289 RepID=A0A512ATH4_9BACT|nr:hypothetical protein [Adhaeribacter aerolatus]GEO03006.1 hypothetical protein AAE02nite_06700 [Adhaeribacter aerolatus]
MREQFEKTPETTAQKVLKYFSLLMTLAYPILGLYLLLSSPEQIALDPKAKIGVGVMLMLYGIYRFYRTYQRYFKANRTTEQND